VYGLSAAEPLFFCDGDEESDVEDLVAEVDVDVEEDDDDEK